MAMSKEERAKRQRENVKRWKAKNPEKVRAQMKRYHLNHREEHNLKMRTRYQTLREKAGKYDELTGNGEG